jgi:TonB-linked SusC/RagA family outer membrane protein
MRHSTSNHPFVIPKYGYMKRTIHVLIGFLLLLAGPVALAQVREVKGRVSDEKGPLQGVSVQVKNTQRGVSSDANGNFTLQADKNETLVISSAGYTAQEVKVGDRTELTITMTAAVHSMDEVVVIGYGTRKRQFLTGAVSSVSGDVLKSRPISNALAGLQGEVPGVIIQRSSGQPGVEKLDLNVRGNSTVSSDQWNQAPGNTPLVLIDGVASSAEQFTLLNPDDIESISVLKDAQAAIYGARAANGVFMVTTKKGRKGTAPKFSYNGNFAVTKHTGLMKSPTHYEFAVMDNEANIHAGFTPMYTPELLEKVRTGAPGAIDHPNGYGWKLIFSNTDWEKALYESGSQQRHNISVSGGGNNSTYYLSGGFSDQQGVIRYADDNNKRYNLRLNYDYDFSKRIRLESKVALDEQHRTDMGGVGSWVVTEGIFGFPNHPVYNEQGQYFAQGGWGNAVAQAKESATSSFKTRNISTNFKLIGEIVNGLKLNLQSGINYTAFNSKDMARQIPLYNWNGNLAYYTVASPGWDWLQLSNQQTLGKNFTAYLDYQKRFGDRHDLTVMAGAAHEESEWESFWGYRQDLVSNDVWSLDLGRGEYKSGSNGADWALRSFFSRVSYAFDNKYLLEANMRYDGSSRFRSDKRWGLFSGLSAGWVLSQEEFMKDLGWFNHLKLRASYGETGNQEVGTDASALYGYLQLININPNSYYPFGFGGRTQTASLGKMAAPDRLWETIKNKNVGVDASILSSRLNFSFDYFTRRNENLLIPITYPSVLGAEAAFTNSGELKTWGFETSLGWNDKVGQFNYSVRAILSDAQSKLVDYGGADAFLPGYNYLREGYPLNTYFAYVYDGVLRTQAEVDAFKQLEGVPSDIGIGDARFKDLNGDGKISYGGNGDDGDVINVGSMAPRYTYGLNLGAKFKGFDLAVFFQGVAKRTIFREGDYSIPWTDWWRQPAQFYYGKTWSADRPDAPMPKLTHGGIRWWNYQPSTLQKINGAYGRLKNLQIGYTLPESLTRKISVSRARIYFSGQDLWEKHSIEGGWDPESERWGFNYPFQRVYSFGIDLNF